jgi:hypothetical protein
MNSTWEMQLLLQKICYLCGVSHITCLIPWCGHIIWYIMLRWSMSSKQYICWNLIITYSCVIFTLIGNNINFFWRPILYFLQKKLNQEVNLSSAQLALIKQLIWHSLVSILWSGGGPLSSPSLVDNSHQTQLPHMFQIQKIPLHYMILE